VPTKPAPVERTRLPLASVQPVIAEYVQDAEIIVVDTPEKKERLEDQFTQVEQEFHESTSTMDIDSDEDRTTEAEESDSDTTLSSKLCIPFTTSRDRQQLRVVRNNFAEEYDPWDTSMVPEYAEDIFRYMRELEVSLSIQH
jgi:hypothetical protein